MSALKQKYEQKTLWVLLLTAVTMVVEIAFGITTKSMALLADGIHMSSHVIAIGLSWLAYVAVRKISTNGNFNGNSEKILSLSGYTSGLLLLGFAVLILAGAFQRFFKPVAINYNDAIIVAIIGLVVNLLSAFILHHQQEYGDHNIRAAYLHVVADAFTSLAAIMGIMAAMIWGVMFVDALAALISSLVIIRWSMKLLKDSGKVLLDIGSNSNK